MRLHSSCTRYQYVAHLRQPGIGRALMYGIECEMEPRARISQSQLLELLGPERDDMFCKEDGSLVNGVELVTIPLRLAEIRAIDWRGLFAPILPYAMAGARTHRCGMHIHINRAALTPLQLGRLLLTVNAPEMRDLMELIAQRPSSGFSRYIPKRWIHGRYPDDDDVGRYQAVNVTQSTIELRLFRGTIRHDRLLKNADAADCLIHYGRETSARHTTDPEAFRRYVSDNAKRWPWLANFLSENGAI